MKVKVKKEVNPKQYFDDSGEFKPMKMVAALKKKFPRLVFDGLNSHYDGYIDNDAVPENIDKWIDTILGHFIVEELGDEARQVYVNEVLKLFKFAAS